MKKYDLIVIGGGPGGYVAAIRAAQLNKKVALIESSHLGGICLNWGCIPTKSLLKNAEVFELIKDSKKYGIEIKDYSVNWEKVIKRSRDIANRMGKGIQFLMKKNKIDVINGFGKIINNTVIEVSNESSKEKYKTDFIIISTGASPNYFPGMEPDGKNIITYKDALVINKPPKHIVIIGAGAIGIEFAYFFNTFGSEVTIVEAQSHILPNEDIEVSKELERIFKSKKINIKTGVKVDNILSKGKTATVNLENSKISCDKVLVAVGVKANSSGLGLNINNIKTDRGWISTNEFMQTNIDNIFAIGDVAGAPWLAHVASAEAITAVEYIYNQSSKPMKYDNIPGCTYCHPEVASVGLTEKDAIDKGFKIKVGKFPLRALGKAVAIGQTDGFVKIIFDEKYGELLGCHIIGANATDLISEISLARDLETTYNEILHSIHPHPTLSEAIMEATADALDEAIHI
ncbi:MAG: dihydrolipoyl dehydrogenase [Candidatus Marinimicrobia bacterium]|nr:dihydrolipoyl dehydrogenase [Candidatus Neomarinimicrobiota bacterium]|tara:strand:+ start:3401 stop:4777 length:1377 start_codon:yes stop_codon:yes gene_type:complete